MQLKMIKRLMSLGSGADMFDMLEAIHMTRMKFIVNKMADYGISCAGLNVLDIGCGIGLCSESMARLGANVTGIDSSHDNLERARQRATKFGLSIDYRGMRFESWSDARKFDIITALEVIEHCEDAELFLLKCSQYLKQSGILFVSTINKNLASLALAKIAAEYILRIVPPKTHDWSTFITPGDLYCALCRHNMRPLDISGISLCSNGWRLTNRLTINYILSATK